MEYRIEKDSLGEMRVPASALYAAQTQHRLATTGPYARIRHPQYVGFVAILLGFLFQWPTLLTVIMFPILLLMYARLAIVEEREMRRQFGDEYERYAERTPRFIPRLALTVDWYRRNRAWWEPLLGRAPVVEDAWTKA